MKNKIEGPLLKLKRAKHHIDDIEKVIDSFFSTAQCKIVVEKDDESEDNLVKIKLVQDIPDMLPLMVGDAIFNIRSSLDHLAVELSKKKTGNYQKVYFPIVDSETKFENLINNNKVNYFPDEAIEILKEIKPYKAGNDLLWSIHKLRNFDTHNFLLPIGNDGYMNYFRNAEIKNAKIGLMITGPRRLDKGIVISNLGKHGTITFKGNNQPNIAISGHMTFGDVEIIGGKDVVIILKKMLQLATNILNGISKECF